MNIFFGKGIYFNIYQKSNASYFLLIFHTRNKTFTCIYICLTYTYITFHIRNEIFIYIYVFHLKKFISVYTIHDGCSVIYLTKLMEKCHIDNFHPIVTPVY